jgi:hypothetical protein
MKSIFLFLFVFIAHTAVDSFRIRGRYKVIFNTDSSTRQRSSYVICFVNDSSYQSIRPDRYISGKIVRDGDTACLIDTATYHPQGHLDNMIYRSFGKQMIEFKETGKDTLKFRTTYVSNLHVTLNEGVLVRMK